MSTLGLTYRWLWDWSLKNVRYFGSVGFMPLPGQTGRQRHSVLNRIICLFVCLFVCYQTCKHDILKTSRPILVPIGTHGPRGKGVKLSTLGVQRLRSHKARDGFGGLTGHHFRPPWVELVFLVSDLRSRARCLSFVWWCSSSIDR